jgi:glycosyltransferase involved in cell wall biosynthesis
MKYSFIVPTMSGDSLNVTALIDSVVTECLDDFEIILVGDVDITGDRIKNIPFDESEKCKWITRKKNLGVRAAKYDNLVLMHSYFRLLPGWFSGMEHFGDDWDVAMTRVLNGDGTRFRDWCLSPKVELPKHRERERLLPYEMEFPGKQYISGGYWLAKKSVMEEYPQDESLVWGESEDIEWSHRCLPNVKYVINQNAAVGMDLVKWASFKEAQPDVYGRLV